MYKAFMINKQSTSEIDNLKLKFFTEKIAKYCDLKHFLRFELVINFCRSNFCKRSLLRAFSFRHYTRRIPGFIKKRENESDRKHFPKAFK